MTQLTAVLSIADGAKLNYDYDALVIITLIEEDGEFSIANYRGL